MSSDQSTSSDHVSRFETESDGEKSAPNGRPRGIYLLPNLFTTCSLFSGFYAIVAAMNHHYISAGLAIFFAMLFDMLDGRVARLINAQSAFGAQYDSLSDMLSFGITPALVMYNFSLDHLTQAGWGRHLGWLSAFLFVACVALRLARFNTQVDNGQESKRYFFGLPSTAGAPIIASLVWVGSSYNWQGEWVAFVSQGVTVIVSLLMVSTLKFRSFKDIDLREKISFTVLLLIVFSFIAISLSPPILLLLIFSLYGLSGPASYLFGRFLNRRA